MIKRLLVTFASAIALAALLPSAARAQTYNTSGGLGVFQTGVNGQCSLSALNAQCIIPMGGMAGASWTISGTWTQTLSFKASSDEAFLGAGSATWPWTLTTNNGSTNSSSTTTNGSFQGTFPNYAAIEVTTTAWTSGTAVVTWHTSVVGQNILQGYNGANVLGGAPGTNIGNTTPGLDVIALNECSSAGAHFDPCQKDPYTAGPQTVTIGGNTAPFYEAAGTATAVVACSAVCRYMGAKVTTAGTSGNVTVYDNASACSGNVIDVIPGTTANPNAYVGYQSVSFQPLVTAGVTFCGATGSPGVALMVSK